MSDKQNNLENLITFLQKGVERGVELGRYRNEILDLKGGFFEKPAYCLNADKVALKLVKFFSPFLEMGEEELLKHPLFDIGLGFALVLVGKYIVQLYGVPFSQIKNFESPFDNDQVPQAVFKFISDYVNFFETNYEGGIFN